VEHEKDGVVLVTVTRTINCIDHNKGGWNMKKMVWFLCLLMVSLTLLSGSFYSAQAEEVIKIGVIQPRSGPLAVSGEDSYWGTKIAIDMVNNAGGIKGKKIEAVVADVPNAGAAQNEVNRLIQNEKVKVITGIYGSAMAEVAAGICNRNNVLYWEHISVTDRLSLFGEQAAQIAENFAGKIGLDPKKATIAVVSENGDFGKSIASGVAKYAKEAGMTIVLNELYDSKTTDTSPIVLKLKASNADIVIATSYINDGIDITKKSKVLDYFPKIFLGIGSGYGLAAYGKSLGADAEGMIDLDPTSSPLVKNLDPAMAKAVAEFQERFQAARGYASPTVGYLAWQATWVLLHNVIAKAGGTDDLAAMINAAKALDIKAGYLPTGAGIKFDENGQNQRPVISAMQWQNGKLVTIYPAYLANAKPIMLPLPVWSKR
jgi:branched-chain amino acid transport system substrate-binding protein